MKEGAAGFCAVLLVMAIIGVCSVSISKFMVSQNTQGQVAVDKDADGGDRNNSSEAQAPSTTEIINDINVQGNNNTVNVTINMNQEENSTKTEVESDDSSEQESTKEVE